MKVHWRDKLAYHLASAAMRIATPWYRKMAHGAWRYGLDAAARDEAEGRELPPHWSKGCRNCGHSFSYHEQKGLCAKHGCNCPKWSPLVWEEYIDEHGYG